MIEIKGDYAYFSSGEDAEALGDERCIKGDQFCMPNGVWEPYINKVGTQYSRMKTGSQRRRPLHLTNRKSPSEFEHHYL